MRRRHTRLRVGDWVKTARGRVFEIVVIYQAGSLTGITDSGVTVYEYGPKYCGPDGETAWASAIVEARRRKP